MTRVIKIVPAILTSEINTFIRMAQQAITYTDFVQIDIMDGEFVPSKSITWDQIREIPQGLKWEVHLMVKNPEMQLRGFQRAGAIKAVFHYEASPDPDKVISFARDLGLKVGLAINPETPVAKILALTEKVDSVLFLSVHPGFYGAKFLPEVLEKVVELRSLKPDLILGIDGGVKENNIVNIAHTGVDEICVGSAILTHPDPGKAYRSLLALANS